MTRPGQLDGSRLEQPGQGLGTCWKVTAVTPAQGPSWPRPRWEPCSGEALGEPKAHAWDIPEETLTWAAGGWRWAEAALEMKMWELPCAAGGKQWKQQTTSPNPRPPSFREWAKICKGDQERQW